MRAKKAESTEPGERRSLTHIGGRTSTSGNPEAAEILSRALDVASSIESSEGEDAARAHVHGFHTYPARMHPTTARRLIEALSSPGDTVLDPFCGSGTVLVEARALGRRAIGSDLNPLAIQLARRKVNPASSEERAAIVARAEEVAAIATERRKAKAGASKRYGKDDVALFDPHVLLELDGLRVGLATLGDGPVRTSLELVLSSILVKVSKKAADTSEAPSAKRIAAGFASRLFVDKARELTERLAAIEPALASGPPATVLEGDARDLAFVSRHSVDLVVTSPPYAGVYDYLDHHKARLRWLQLHDRRLERDEIGARRDLGKLSAEAAWERFFEQMSDTFKALARVAKTGGRVVFLIADATRGRHVLASERLVGEAARAHRFDVVAIGSQARPHFKGPREEKLEHAVLLMKEGSR